MSIAEREIEIERTRARLGETIERIQDKLTLSGMVDEALGSGVLPNFDGRYAKALAAVRNNPVPVLIVAAGIGYVLSRIARRERLAGRHRLGGVGGDGSGVGLNDGLGDASVVNDGRARVYDLDGPGGTAMDGRRRARG